jgi:glutathione S-transferase
VPAADEGATAPRREILVDCAYCPIFNVIEKAGFNLAGFPKVSAYLDTIRARPAWKETPKLPGL